MRSILRLLPRLLPPLAAAMVLAASLAPAAPAEQRRCGGRGATVVGTAQRDRIRGTNGSDVVVAGGGRDAVLGRSGDDLVCSGGRGDRVRGGPGADRILGQGGADTLDGDEGDDELVGGGGADVCFQGAGSGRSKGCVPVVAAAGDIACARTHPDFHATNGSQTRCHMRYTSDLLLRTNLAAVLALGDLQYESGELEDFRASYDPTWGRVKAITRPVPGNHEYRTFRAADYFEYFGAAAGDPDRGYYSFDLGAWHLVGLNTTEDCGGAVGGCTPGSPQNRWLAADLAADPARCTLAYFHEPLFSSQATGDPELRPFWNTLSDDGAELVLNGHAHVYERFAPQTPDGVADRRGIRQFIVGTGGKDLVPFVDDVERNSQVRQATTFGVLELALAPGRYQWRFVSEARPLVPFSDRGAGRCH